MNATAAQPRIKVIAREVRIQIDGEDILEAVEPGDLVVVCLCHGQERRGRAQIVLPTHAVLDGGSAHGSPVVATADNIVRVDKKR
jgi:hypothetical protein